MNKLPYVAPELEIDEYSVELGLASSIIMDYDEMTEITDAAAETEAGGEWGDNGDLGGFSGDIFDF